jgi:CubicO group peptidase (beta-lactamase class C family)
MPVGHRRRRREACWTAASTAASSPQSDAMYLKHAPFIRGSSQPPTGVIRFGPETLHDMRSVSKSIVGLLYGIALTTGCVPVPEANLLSQFPEYSEPSGDSARHSLTVKHALTMTLGTDWDELTPPYTDPRNGETAMNNAADRYRYVLQRPVIEPPGKRWIFLDI